MLKRYVPSARPYDDKGTMLHVIVLANTDLVQPTISKTAARLTLVSMLCMDYVHTSCTSL